MMTVIIDYIWRIFIKSVKRKEILLMTEDIWSVLENMNDYESYI